MEVILLKFSRMATYIAAMLFLLSANCSAGEDRRWQEQGSRLSAEIREFLVEVGKCKSPDDCARGKYFFFRSTEQGLETSLYDIQDRATISVILGKLATTLASERMQSITLKVYEKSKKMEMERAGVFGERALMEFSVGGKYASSNR